MIDLKQQLYEALVEFSKDNRFNVNLPSHIFIPEDAESVDARRCVEISKNTDKPVEILRIEAKEGEYFRFIKYAVFTDAELAENIEFIPKLNGKRILRQHGTPDKNMNYRISLGLSPDISEGALISCDINLKPHNVLTWEVYNKSDVDIPVAVRMVGYSSAYGDLVKGNFR